MEIVISFGDMVGLASIPGASCAKSITLTTCDCSRSAPDSAVSEIGTDWLFSFRRCAVTVTSSMLGLAELGLVGVAGTSSARAIENTQAKMVSRHIGWVKRP